MIILHAWRSFKIVEGKMKVLLCAVSILRRNCQCIIAAMASMVAAMARHGRHMCAEFFRSLHARLDPTQVIRLGSHKQNFWDSSGSDVDG